MSYTPDNENIEDPILNIIRGIKEFDSAVDNIVDSDEYNNEYKEKLSELSIDLRRIKLKLKTI